MADPSVPAGSQPPRAPLPVSDRALIEESAKKSALVWVRGPRGPRRALWHVWHDGAVHLVGDGPAEQPLKPLGLADGAAATVSVRSKDKGGLLAVWPARVVELPPGGEEWREAVAGLAGKRLNAPDATTIAERWARECRVLRLEPAGALLEGPGSMPEDLRADVPPPTPATTRSPAPAGLPKLLRRGRAGRKGR
ncbi:hypothetical protein ACGRHY_08645 [Streptomyces sp. HK10]|uniref:hypothetical protein n=1 Tax=Streptomyces sp. HK10 TaxID=3373255 RepID=UPI00374A1DD1